MPEKPPQKIPSKASPGDFVPVTEEELSEDKLVTLLEADGDPFATLKAAAKATTGQLYCWGENHLGNLGTSTGQMCREDGAIACSTTPISVRLEVD